jgi:dihydrofolate reductase
VAATLRRAGHEARGDLPKAVLAAGDGATEIDALKRSPGNDIVVYGGSSLVAAHFERRLLDD